MPCRSRGRARWGRFCCRTWNSAPSLEKGGHQVGAPGDVFQRDEREKFADEEMGDVSAGMRHPQRGAQGLELGGIAPQKRGRERADV